GFHCWIPGDVRKICGNCLVPHGKLPILRYGEAEHAHNHMERELLGELGDEIDLAPRAECCNERASLLFNQGDSLCTKFVPMKRRIDGVPVACVLVPVHAGDDTPMNGLNLPDVVARGEHGVLQRGSTSW